MGNLPCFFVHIIFLTGAVHFGLTFGFEWTPSSPSDGSTVDACVGEKVHFRWEYSSSLQETVVYIEWQQIKENGKSVLLATHVSGHLFKVPSNNLKVGFLPNAGIEISNYTWEDYGQYKVTVHFTDNGVLQSQSRSMVLAPPDAPVLSGNRLEATIQPEPVTDVTSGERHLQISCGLFLKQGSPPVSVVWRTPDRARVQSTSYANGSFYLTLPNPVKGGSYRCQLEDPSLAARCVKSVSGLSRGGHVHVDEVKARLALLEDKRLTSQITDLQEELVQHERTDDTITSQIKSLQERVAQHESTDDIITSQITGLQEILAEQENNGDTLTSQINSLREKLAQHESTDDTLTSQITRLQEQMQQRDDMETKLTSDAKTLTSELKALIQQVKSKHEADFDALRQQVADIQHDSSILNDISRRPASCVDVREYDRKSGVHILTVNNRHITVFCDQYTAGGGWTVFQRRVDGQVDFYRNWYEYENGFGNLTHEFWLGLYNIHQMTSSQQYILRVDLMDFDLTTAYAQYNNFSIAGRDDLYRLSVGRYSGSAGDSLDYSKLSTQNNRRFSTWDKDHDVWGIYSNCARDNSYGGWWYSQCGYVNLNGRYNGEGARGWDNILWYHWKNDNRSYKRVAIKIKPMT